MTKDKPLNPEMLKKAEALARDIGVPAQPDVVMQVLQEVNADNPDLKRIVDVVSKDVSMTAKVMKVANSPFFARARIDSLLHCMQILGIHNFYNIILLCSLEDVLDKSWQGFEAFWSHSKNTAMIASYIARKLRVVPEEQAYLAGLFHDSAIALLIKRFPDYFKILNHALYIACVKPLSDKFSTIDALESDTYNTNHCIMGHVLANSWKLPPAVTYTILHHHHPDISVHKNEQYKKLCALLHIAEYIEMAFTLSSTEFVAVYESWSNTFGGSMKELELSLKRIDQIIKDLTALLE